VILVELLPSLVFFGWGVATLTVFRPRWFGLFIIALGFILLAAHI
jgi:hypothetical protein